MCFKILKVFKIYAMRKKEFIHKTITLKYKYFFSTFGFRDDISGCHIRFPKRDHKL